MTDSARAGVGDTSPEVVDDDIAEVVDDETQVEEVRLDDRIDGLIEEALDDD